MKPLWPPNAASVWDHNSAERESSLYSGVKHAVACEAITSVRKQPYVDLQTFIIMISDLGCVQSLQRAAVRGEEPYFNAAETDFSLKVHLTRHQLLPDWDLFFLFSINMEMNTGVLCRKISLAHTNCN